VIRRASCARRCCCASADLVVCPLLMFTIVLIPSYPRADAPEGLAGCCTRCRCVLRIHPVIIHVGCLLSSGITAVKSVRCGGEVLRSIRRPATAVINDGLLCINAECVAACPTLAHLGKGYRRSVRVVLLVCVLHPSWLWPSRNCGRRNCGATLWKPLTVLDFN
jgi:hypothetical protein